MCKRRLPTRTKQEFITTMAEMLSLFKPKAFKIKKEGDPDHLLREFEDYLETFGRFVRVSKMGEEHTNGHVAEAGGGTCKGCVASKDILLMIGGKEMERLFKHTGMVLDTDTFDAGVEKVRQGIRKQTNQASARFKLMQQMSQSGVAYSKWYPEVRDQAERCDWTNYGAKEAARDAILFQCDDRKLMKKIMAEDLNFEDTVKVGLAMEQGEKKVEEIRSSKNGRKEEEKVAKLEVKDYPLNVNLHDLVRALAGHSKKEKDESKKTRESCDFCHYGHRKGQSCPAKDKDCLDCGKKGHFKNTKTCPKKKKAKKEATRRLESDQSELSDESDTEESVGRVKEEESDDVRALKDKVEQKSEEALMKVIIKDHKELSKPVDVKLLIDSGVHKTLLSEKDWNRVKPMRGNKPAKLKVCHTRFSPFGTNLKLPILGRSKCILKATCGKRISTVIYVVKGESQSLLDLRDGKALGIISINPDGQDEQEKVNRVTKTKRLKVVVEGEVSGGQTQKEIDKIMDETAARHAGVFKGLGRAKVELIDIEIDETVKPVKQKERRVALHFKEPFKQHIAELKAAGVVSGPLPSECATGWICNPVIRSKKWSDKKIRVTLDTRPMAEAVKPTSFPIPTPMELRHEFNKSDRYSQLDMNHSFHQFEMSDPSKDLFKFYGPDGLYRFNTLVQAVLNVMKN